MGLARGFHLAKGSGSGDGAGGEDARGQTRLLEGTEMYREREAPGEV